MAAATMERVMSQTFLIELMNMLPLLPLQAQEKLNRLLQQAEEFRLASMECSDRARNSFYKIQRLEAERAGLGHDRSQGITAADASILHQLSNQKSSGEGLLSWSSKTIKAPPLDELRSEIDKKIAAVKDENKRLEERLENYRARLQAIDSLSQSIRRWLKTVLLSGVTISLHPPAKTREVPTPALIENKRRHIGELRAEKKYVDCAHFENAASKSRAREQIEQLAELGEPNVYELIEQGGKITWPARELDIMSLYMDKKMAPDGVALVAWLFREKLISAIEAKIDAETDGKALTDEQRAEQFKVCLDKLLQAEREEEALVELASFDVIRRPDADPRAVLGLSSTLPGLPQEGFLHRRMIEALTAADLAGKNLERSA
jgi:hypothetical protein